MKLISTQNIDNIQNTDKLCERFVVYSKEIQGITSIQNIQHVQIDIDIKTQNANYINDGTTSSVVSPYDDNNKLAFYINYILSKEYDYSYWNKEGHSGEHSSIQDIKEAYEYNKYEDYNNIRLQNIQIPIQEIKNRLVQSQSQHILTQNILLDYVFNQNDEFTIDRYYRPQHIDEFKNIIEEIINPTTTTTTEPA